LALIKCNAVKHTVLGYKTIDDVPIASEIACVGSPYGYDNNVSAGILSSKGRSIEDDTGIQYFFMDLSIFPGSSGGPVVDLNDGLTIGIVAIIVRSVGSYGLNAAIPMDYAIDRFKKYIK
jgi:serine protease Do